MDFGGRLISDHLSGSCSELESITHFINHRRHLSVIRWYLSYGNLRLLRNRCGLIRIRCALYCWLISRLIGGKARATLRNYEFTRLRPAIVASRIYFIYVTPAARRDNFAIDLARDYCCVSARAHACCNTRAVRYETVECVAFCNYRSLAVPISGKSIWKADKEGDMEYNCKFEQACAGIKANVAPTRFHAAQRGFQGNPRQGRSTIAFDSGISRYLAANVTAEGKAVGMESPNLSEIFSRRNSPTFRIN